jgi:hypothetical protein
LGEGVVVLRQLVSLLSNAIGSGSQP